MALFTAHYLIYVVHNAIGGQDQPDTTTATYTTARLSAKLEDVCLGMSHAKRFALNKELVDLTQPLARAWPSYSPGNIQYQDVTKNQTPPFWLHLMNFSIDTGKNDVYVVSWKCSVKNAL